MASRFAALLTLAILTAFGCTPSGVVANRHTLTVFAASSLKPAFDEIGKRLE